MYENVRVQHFYFHDSNTRFSGSGVHPGCFMMDNNVGGLPKHNLVFDHLVCERVATVGIQLADSGVTFQNSVFSCPDVRPRPIHADRQMGPLRPLAVPSRSRLPCRPGSRLRRLECRHPLQRLHRRVHRASVSGNGGPYGTFSNVSVVGNVFGASLTCGRPGISYDSNTFLNGVGACGTNATSLSAGDPFVQSSMASPNSSWSAVSRLNARPDGSPALPTISVVSGSDLDLGADADGAPRSGTTRPGAYR